MRGRIDQLGRVGCWAGRLRIGRLDTSPNPYSPGPVEWAGGSPHVEMEEVSLFSYEEEDPSWITADPMKGAWKR